MNEPGIHIDASAGNGDEVAVLRSALEAAEQAAAAARDAQLRAMAELENVRKRSQREIENAQRFALERFAAELLPARDSLELAVQSSAQADTASLVAGQQATLQLLNKAFDKFSIQRVDPQGAVRNAHALRSSQREFEASAGGAVSAWKFKAGEKDGMRGRR